MSDTPRTDPAPAMKLADAIAVLRLGAKTTPAAVMAWACKLTHDNPKDAPVIAAILYAAFVTNLP